MDIKTKRNNTARKFEPSCRLRRNCLQFARMNGRAHYLEQFGLCHAAFVRRHEFLTEATLDTPVLKERLRADFVDLDTSEVYEVAVSESESSLKHKEIIWAKYGFKMVVIDGRL